MLIFGGKNGTLRMILIYYMKLYKSIHFRGLLFKNIPKSINYIMKISIVYA